MKGMLVLAGLLLAFFLVTGCTLPGTFNEEKVVQENSIPPELAGIEELEAETDAMLDAGPLLEDAELGK